MARVRKNRAGKSVPQHRMRPPQTQLEEGMTKLSLTTETQVTLI